MSRKRQVNADGGVRIPRKVGLTPEQDARLTVLAEKHGMSVQRFMVSAALAAGESDSVGSRQEIVTSLLRVEFELSRVGNNLNQMARRLNALNELDPGCGDLLDEIRDVVTRYDEVLNDLAVRDGELA